jgi:YesN/AraC family two-component response regulator
MLGELDKSSEYYFLAIGIREKMHDEHFIAQANMNLGLLYSKMKNYDLATESFYKSLPVFIDFDDKRNIANCYQNLFIVEFYTGKYKKAEEHFRESLKFALPLNDSSQIATIYSDYADGQFDNNNFRKALKNYKISYFYSNAKKYRVAYNMAKYGIGKALLYLNQLNKSEQYLKESRKEFIKFRLPEQQLLVEEALARLYAKSGQWEKFNLHMNEFNRLITESMKKEEYRALSEHRALHETAKKNEQIALQKIELEKKNAQLFLIGGIAVLVLAGLITAIIFAGILNKRNQLLIEKNRELSERWESMNLFYLNPELQNFQDKDSALFGRITKLMTDEKYYSRTDLSINLIAKELSSNVKYISKAIKEKTKMNFNTFVNTYRVEAAKRLLADNSYNIWTLDAIAEQCGFNNSTSFYQAFKKITGFTPAAYRKVAV